MVFLSGNCSLSSSLEGNLKLQLCNGKTKWQHFSSEVGYLLKVSKYWNALKAKTFKSCGSNALPLNWQNRFQSVMLKLVTIKDFIRCIKKFEWQSNVWIFLGVRRLPRGFLKATNTVTSRPFLQWKSQRLAGDFCIGEGRDLDVQKKLSVWAGDMFSGAKVVGFSWNRKALQLQQQQQYLLMILAK